MARLAQLVDYARRHGLRLINIADLIRYRLDTERFVRRQAEAALPSAFGQFRAIGYRNELDGSEHVAIVKGRPEQAEGPVLVRVHSECLTGDAFGSLRCDCRPQLEAALRMVEAAGEGVVVYLRQEGRGIGLINKLRAYSLQDGGLDTVEANERLGFPADLRNYGVGAQILSDLGVHRLRLITNNPRKIAGLGGYGLQVEDRVPLVMDPSQHNAAYLQTKQAKLGHLMDEAGPTSGPAAVLAWKRQAAADGAPASNGGGLAAQLQELRQWAEDNGLELEREEHSRVLALLDQPDLAVVVAGGDPGRLDQGLRRMAHWQHTQSVSLLLAADAQRSNHPSNTLEAQRRPLLELSAAAGSSTALPLEGATLLRWS
jgi:3,4-dihydroxy 2-butanone 4-phosphate synthase/GTP cyclohydrolase II